VEGALQVRLAGRDRRGGGRFVVRGGELAVLEGEWLPKRLVVLEFEGV